MIIAGIGSRQTPLSVCVQMVQIGAWCLANQIEVRSGHAEGADYAFERGAARNCTVFLPWAGFNKQLEMLGSPIVVEEDFDLELRKYHPAYSRLTPGAKKLMGRNVCQVKYNNIFVDAVVCWRVKQGGTDFALSIARDFQIPIINMHDEKFKSAEKVIQELQRIDEN